MKAIIERFSGELSARYLPYLETLMVDLVSDAGALEFRCGFALRSDHELRSFVVQVPAKAALTDKNREVIVEAVFKQLETLIDEAIAQGRANTN